MSDSIASLRHKITSAGEISSVVRTMKVMAASNIRQYENAVRSLDDYYRTVQLGLVAYFRQDKLLGAVTQLERKEIGAIGAIVFGSDQGLVGQFNDVMVEFVINMLDKLPGKKTVWVVGERIQSRFAETNLLTVGNFTLPNSLNAITPLVGHVLTEMELQCEKGKIAQVYIFHNRPQPGAIFTPMSQQLLPLDGRWRHNLATMQWPTQNLPEVMNSGKRILQDLIHEYLFVSLFRACAESLASENANRLAAMQRAEKNIDELKEELNRKFYRLRQSGIDEELFDVISGFEALTES